MKNGYVYVVHSANKESYKIGMTNDVEYRLQSLGVTCKEKLRLIHVIPSSDCRKAERALHILFRKKRMDGEWFCLDSEDIEKVSSIRNDDDIESICLSLHIEPPQKTDRYMFAVSNIDASREFVNRCKRRGYIASAILSKLMSLYNSGILDSAIHFDGEDKKIAKVL